MKELALFLYTETSLHAGTGSTVSAVDLPIQRERTTRHPVVQGSGVKGALRSQVMNQNDELIKVVFGPSAEEMQNSETDDRRNAMAYAGALSVGDARIVLFPVRSLSGVFAYTISPMVLARLYRSIPNCPTLSQVPQNGNALVTSPSAVTLDKQVILEEFSFAAQSNKEVDFLAQWLSQNAFPESAEYGYWREKLLTSLVILSDDDFTEFTINSTEITTRIRIDTAKKTVEKGALWTQESLPSDTVLMSSIQLSDSRHDGGMTPSADLVNWLVESLPPRIQIGGDETTGQGFVAMRWLA